MADQQGQGVSAREVLQFEIDHMAMQIAVRRQALHILQRAEEGVVESSERPGHEVVNIGDRRLSSMRLRDAMAKVLEQNGAMTLSALEDRLKHGGASLGKDQDRWPRNIKITVTANPKIFHLRNGLVELKHPPKAA